MFTFYKSQAGNANRKFRICETAQLKISIKALTFKIKLSFGKSKTFSKTSLKFTLTILYMPR